jgi:antitoxin FitA
MAMLTLKNVPDALVDRLKAEARRNRRSLNQEALTRLESSVARESRGGEETVVALRKLHARLEGVRPLTDGIVARARREGRP